MDLAARILHALGLDHDLAPLVLLVGHGSQSVNNAHAASLDCDACCGQTGEVNARALASILNEPAVRAGLADRGVVVPERTVFVAALHVTTMDEIEWFDLDLLPPSVRPEWGAPGCTRIGGAWLVAPVASGGRANQPLLIQRLGSFGSWNRLMSTHVGQRIALLSEALFWSQFMPTRVYLVRHGATSLTAEDRFAGSSDVTLSDEGRRQVASLAERLKNERLDAIYASPLVRTVETARILAAPHDLTPIPDPALREIDYGHWEGLTRSEVECNYAEEYAIWQEDPFTIAPKGGESGVNVINRALPVFRRIVETHRHRIVLVVSHKGTNRLLISSLLGFDMRGYRDRLDQSPAGLTILDFMSEVRPRLRLFNDVSHYENVPQRILTQRLSKWWGSPQPA